MNPKDWPARAQMPHVLASDGECSDYWRAEYYALEARLRTTAEALRAATTWAAPMRDAPKSARPAWFDAARAVLAQLEQEGLT